MTGETYHTVDPYQGCEPDDIFTQLEDVINGFRFGHCDRQRYDQLSGTERMHIPTIEQQVNCAAEKIHEWLGDTASSCISLTQDEDEILYATSQLHDLCANAQTTRGRIDYWRQNYPQPDSNMLGRFTEWAVRRKLRPIFQTSLAKLALGQPGIGPVTGTLLESIRSFDPAKIAVRDPELRRTAYITRRDTKIGLACVQAIPPDFSQNVLSMSPAEPDKKETPELITLLRDQQHDVLNFLAPLETETLEAEPMPF